MCRVSTSSSAGPSRVSRPRRSSASTSNGSTASSTGTAEGARTGISSVLMSGDGEVMALYLGSAGENRKGRKLAKSISSRPREGGDPTSDGSCCTELSPQLLQLHAPGSYGSRLKAGTTAVCLAD